MKNASARIASIIAASAASMSLGYEVPRERKARKPVPTMVTASREEIAAWNAAIEARKPPKPSKHHRNFRGDTGQHPKFAKERTRKEHKHPLRDDHGAYTLVGNNPFMPRRKWLGGISAQRGF